MSDTEIYPISTTRGRIYVESRREPHALALEVLVNIARSLCYDLLLEDGEDIEIRRTFCRDQLVQVMNTPDSRSRELALACLFVFNPNIVSHINDSLQVREFPPHGFQQQPNFVYISVWDQYDIENPHTNLFVDTRRQRN